MLIISLIEYLINKLSKQWNFQMSSFESKDI